MKAQELTFSDLAALAIGRIILSESLTDDETQHKFEAGSPTEFTPEQVRRALEIRGIPGDWFNDAMKILLDEQFEGDFKQ